MRRRHLLMLPDGTTTEVDVGIGERGPCDGCDAAENRDMTIHAQDCPVATTAAMRSGMDVTTEAGAGTLAAATRLRLAQEFADDRVGQGGDDSTPLRRRDLIAGYLAGHQRATRDLTSVIKTGIARLTGDVDAWLGIGRGEDDHEK